MQLGLFDLDEINLHTQPFEFFYTSTFLLENPSNPRELPLEVQSLNYSHPQ